MMRLRELFADREAVSPVIGVILMVAITVILAAVIASFVLGLGSQTETTPQASLAIDYDKNANPTVGGSNYDGNLTVTHDSGDPVTDGQLYIRGDNFCKASSGSATNDSWQAYNTGYDCSGSSASTTSTSSGTTEGETAVVAGDRLTTGADDDYDVSVVFESNEGGSSSTLATDSGPAA